MGLPRWLSGKEPSCNAGEVGSLPGLGRSPGGENGDLLQYSCLENSMDRGAWCSIVHGVEESDTTERLSTHMSRDTVCPWAYTVLGMHRNGENGFFPNINSAWQIISIIWWKYTPLPQVQCLYGTNCDFLNLHYCDSVSLSNKYWAEWFI